MKFIALTTVLLLLLASVAHAEEDHGKMFYEVINPLLKTKCISCHGPVKQEGNLRLDSLAAVIQGGDSGPAIKRGDANNSLILQAIRHLDGVSEMPPKENLPADKVAAFDRWISSGAIWPRSVLVLFDDEIAFIESLTKGKATIRVENQDRKSGKFAVVVTPRERFSEQISDWKFAIRQHPKYGEYRFIRFAWKKIGGGGAMIEVANSGKWPDATIAAGRYVSGKNETGLAAVSLADDAPEQWSIETIDLWQDLGDFTLTGLSLMASEGKETLFDEILLAPNQDSLDAYRPGRGELAFRLPEPTRHVGTAWTDAENPIVKIFNGERLDLWSLKPPLRPKLPAVKNSTQALSPIDHFVLKRLKSKGLSISPETDRSKLIRRLSFDLNGLPPTPLQVQEFIKDESPQAYQTLVERLLASERFGEQWARHWLDLVRYADTNGYERDEFRSSMFRYRDYVIRSLNADKPYDQFLQEQLAGDELLSGTPQTQSEVDMLIATGYLRLGGFDSTAPIFQEEKKFRNELMADIVNTTSSAMLGLTVSCCNCHDHKYDPISQADHFRLRAFFAAVQNSDDTIVDTAKVCAEIDAHNKQIDLEIAAWEKESSDILNAAKARVAKIRRAEFTPEIITLLEIDLQQRSEQDTENLKPWLEKLNVSSEDAEAAMTKAEKLQRDKRIELVKNRQSQRRDYLRALTTTDSSVTAPQTLIFYQGDHTQPREKVQPGFLSYLDPNPAKIALPLSGKTTGRRLALARWITSPKNPFTARVMVNRIWQQYFGHGIVATPNDYGYSGARPTHPELLDWLATELINSGWSLKHIHRIIVQSATYRQASQMRSAAHTVDPENKFLWRQNVRRITAETLRDAMLITSGRLLPLKSGPPKWPPVPDEILLAQPAILEAIKGKDDGRQQNWYSDPVESTYVRSIFLIQKRSVPLPFLQPFDLPDTTTSCAQREVTTVAPQALNLLNSPFAIQMANSLAKRVELEAGPSQTQQIERAIWLTLLRAPHDDEITDCLELLQRHTELHAQLAESAPHAALIDLCRTLLNINEFVYID
ncbi:MAG: PSD1 and planctomycete cytochrome C domain-containing protein [Pirellulales bacterium]